MNHPSFKRAVQMAAVVLLPLALTPARAGNSLLISSPSAQYVWATVPQMYNNYTLCAWVYLRQGGNEGARLGVFSAPNCGDSTELLVHSSDDSDADPQYLELGRCDSFSGAMSAGTVAINQWEHLAVTVGPDLTVS